MNELRCFSLQNSALGSNSIVEVYNGVTKHDYYGEWDRDNYRVIERGLHKAEYFSLGSSIHHDSWIDHKPNDIDCTEEEENWK